ncbi:YusW family protein [Evansella halocellulosilytica]|uniref:YusW family protein n=1 Tax=Evansella halocellulosilytica TaxID=2011013 RepID=UPI000BB93FD6|nr:YusW family protein [Evansella halocellulosilytica]
MSKKYWILLFVILFSFISACGTAEDQPPENGGADIDDNIEDDLDDDHPDDDPENGDVDTGDQEDDLDQTMNITDFELEIEVTGEGDLIDIEYEDEHNGFEAKYIVRDESLRGDEARDEIFSLFEELDLTPELSDDDVIDRILQYFDLERADITDFELEVEFDGQDRIDIDRDSLN